MEQANELNFLSTLLPFAGVVFVIALSVILLNLTFQRNLYLQMLKNEELKSIHLQDLLTSLLVAQEEERKRIAANLHNELIATHSTARIQIVQLEQQGDDVNKTALQDIRSASDVEADPSSTLTNTGQISKSKLKE